MVSDIDKDQSNLLFEIVPTTFRKNAELKVTRK